MYTLWYSGKPAWPPLSALGVSGSPTKTHSRHIEFGGNFISPESVYSGRYRDCADSAMRVCADCAMRARSAGIDGACISCANAAAARTADAAKPNTIAGVL